MCRRSVNSRCSVPKPLLLTIVRMLPCNLSTTVHSVSASLGLQCKPVSSVTDRAAFPARSNLHRQHSRHSRVKQFPACSKRGEMCCLHPGADSHSTSSTSKHEQNVVKISRQEKYYYSPFRDEAPRHEEIQ